MCTMDKGQVYQDYQKKVYGYIYGKLGHKEKAEDLCAEVFVRVYRNWEKFDREKASISTWIYAITRNIVIDYFRSGYANMECVKNVTDAELLRLPEVTCEDTRLELLAEGLEQLPAKERDIIVLHYYDDFTLKEVAEKMQMSYSNVRLLHKKALDKLEHFLEEA